MICGCGVGVVKVSENRFNKAGIQLFTNTKKISRNIFLSFNEEFWNKIDVPQSNFHNKIAI